MEGRSGQSKRDFASLQSLESLEHLLGHVRSLAPRTEEEAEPFVGWERELAALIHTQRVILAEAEARRRELERKVGEGKGEARRLVSAIQGLDSEIDLVRSKKKEAQRTEAAPVPATESRGEVLRELEQLERKNGALGAQLRAQESRREALAQRNRALKAQSQVKAERAKNPGSGARGAGDAPKPGLGQSEGGGAEEREAAPREESQGGLEAAGEPKASPRKQKGAHPHLRAGQGRARGRARAGAALAHAGGGPVRAKRPSFEAPQREKSLFL